MGKEFHNDYDDEGNNGKNIWLSAFFPSININTVHNNKNIYKNQHTKHQHIILFSYVLNPYHQEGTA